MKAVDLAGNVSAASASKTIVYDNTPPGTPTNLVAHEPDQPAEPVVDGADRRLAASTTTRSTATANLVGSTTLTSFVDTPAPAEGTYAYTVAAFDNAGNSGTPSAPKLVVVDTTPPPAPTGLSGATRPAPSRS